MSFKGHVVGEGRIDFLVENSLVVELKAVQTISDVHLAQTISYLRMRGDRIGLILNFNVPAMNSRDAIRRVILG